MTPEFLALQTALSGRYSLERELGRGGMGIVFLARDAALDRPVAIKLLPPDMTKDAELKERFLREARTAAQLSHPNIVPIHLVEEKDGLVYFVMGFIEGESLGERVQRQGPLRSAETVRLMQEVSWALAYAHGRGVVHRDIKPDNILIERSTGRAVVTDFGIARSAADPSITSQGLVLGTPQYMAPEQFDAAVQLDGRADIYALGITSFFAVSGRLPFHGDTPPQLMAAHLMEPPPPVASVATTLPARLAEAIDRCLAKEPAARWDSGEALAAAVGDAGSPSAAMPPSIRAFVSGIESAFTQLGLLALVAMFVPEIIPEQSGNVLGLLAVFSLLPLITALAAARAVGIAGFGASDVAQAVANEAKLSDRYTEHRKQEIERSIHQMRRPAPRIGAGLIGLLQVVAGIGMLVDGFRDDRPLWKLVLLIPLSGFIVWFGVELAGFALQAGPFRTRLETWFKTSAGRGHRIAQWFWRSPPIRGLLALARLGLKTRPAEPLSAMTSNAPTAVLIARAAGDMFASLPATDRAALAMVPDVLKRLERAASELRERRAKLDQALGAVGEAGGGTRRAAVSADLEAQRTRIEGQLKAALEAMENLRLDLLKLRAGLGSTDDLTEAIAAARRIGDDVDFVIQGRREASQIA